MINKNEDLTIQLIFEVKKDVIGLGILLYIKNSETGEVITSIKEVISKNHFNAGIIGKININIDKFKLRPKEYSFYICLSDASYKNFYDVIDENVNLPFLKVNSPFSDPHIDNGYVDLEYSIETIF